MLNLKAKMVEGTHQYFKRVIAQSGSPAFCRSTEQAIECTNILMEVLYPRGEGVRHEYRRLGQDLLPDQILCPVRSWLGENLSADIGFIFKEDGFSSGDICGHQGDQERF